MKYIERRKLPFIFLSMLLMLVPLAGFAATFFDPINQPIGSVGPYSLSKRGLADGQANIFRPYFNDSAWWGDLESFNVDANGNIRDANAQLMTEAVVTYVPNWSARVQLDAMDYTDRRILSRRDDTGAAVLFSSFDGFSDAQQTSLESQDVLNFLRGDRTNEPSAEYRARSSRLGDIINSSPIYVEYDTDDLDENRVFIGANDGMLHAFNASTGAEEFAYVPSEVIPSLISLKSPGYNDGHRFFVNGEMVIDDIVFADGTTHKILVGGLGAGGQAYYALDITDNDALTDTSLTNKLLWEISDNSENMANLGYSYSRPLLAQVRSGGATQWAIIFGNGYSNTKDDGTSGTGKASLFIVNAETGALIKEISTNSGSLLLPNGLSSPSAADLDSDDVVDYVYAGDLDGHIWRFDLTGDVADWGISFSGSPFVSLLDVDSVPQPVTIPPTLLRHPDGGLLLLAGTGRMLSTDDPENAQVQSVYGLRDRLDSTPLTLDFDLTEGNIVIQSLFEGSYLSDSELLLVRTSTDEYVADSKVGWVVDLTAGERVLTPLRFRSGHLLFSSINPTLIDPSDPLNERGGEVWVNEISFLTGGAPNHIIYDMNEDGNLTVTDNIDGNDDGDMIDAEDLVTGLLQGYGIVLSSPTLAVLDAITGTYFVNRLLHSEEVTPPVVDPGPGLAGGHFDVDTNSEISSVDNGSTDAHVHEYDDKYDVTGVDFFAFHDGGLHELEEDITLTGQKFKLIVVNADQSPGGRLVINQTYDATDDGSYVGVTDYDNTSVTDLEIYTLSQAVAENEIDGADEVKLLTDFGLYFDVNAILDNQLVPTQTGCVRSNTRSFSGLWRNAALTVWAVAVNDDNSDSFMLETDAATGVVTGISNGLLWESTLFWHWKGPCAHEYESLDDEYTVVDGVSASTIVNQATGVNYTIFEFYRDKTIQNDDKKKKKDKKRGKKDKKEKKDKDDTGVGGESETPGDVYDENGEVIPSDGSLPIAENRAILETVSHPAWLGNPFRVSWSEL